MFFCAALIILASAVNVYAIRIYGVTTTNNLVYFDSASTGTVTTVGAITGIVPGENILGIDFRPANGVLYGLGSTSRLYRIDKNTGAATPVNPVPFTPALVGTSFGFDFNPVVDRIRVVSDANQNLRLNPDTGTVVGGTADTPLAYAPGDPNAGQDPNVASVFYTENYIGSTFTDLFGIDNTNNIVPAPRLVRISNPNAGTLNTVANIAGLVPPQIRIDSADFSSANNQSGSATQTAFLLGNDPLNIAGSRLYTLTFTVSTANAATDLGVIGGVTPVTLRGIAVELAAVPSLTVYGITALTPNNLLTFNTTNPNPATPNVIAITGLQPGETVVGIDFRLANGTLYGVTDQSRLYTINRTTGAATPVNAVPFTPALVGTSFGFDFNPVVDRIRVVSDADQNLRLDPNTGMVVGGTADTPLAYAPGDPNTGQNPNIVAAAYTNNFSGTTTTTLYDIDSNLDILARQGDVGGTPTSPNSGLLFTVGSLNFNTTNNVGFDITGGANVPLAALQLINGMTPENTSKLFTIDLATGRAIFIAPIAGEPLTSLAVVNAGATAAGANVSGRVLAGKGRGVYRAAVTVTNLTTQESRIVFTNPFGYFMFEDLPVGDNYVINVRHKRYGFANNGTRVFQLLGQIEDLVFIADEPR